MGYRSLAEPCLIDHFNSCVKQGLREDGILVYSDDVFCTHTIKEYRCFRGRGLPLKRDLIKIHGDKGHDDPNCIVGFEVALLADGASDRALEEYYGERVCIYCSNGQSSS